MTDHAAGTGGHPHALVMTRGPADVFEAASKGAARRLRDSAIPEPREFDDDERLAIILKWGDRTLWQVRREGEWRDLCVTVDRGA